MEERYYEDEMDIGDLLLFCLSHWRSILVIVLIGFLLGGGYKAASVLEGNTVVHETQEQQAAELEAARYLVENSEKKVDALNQYLAGTKLMDLNPYDLYQGNCIYTVDVAEEQRKDVMTHLLSFAAEGKLYAWLAENTEQYSTVDLQQIVSVTGAENSKISIKDADFTYTEAETSADTHVFAVNILGETQKEAAQLLEQVQKAIDSYLEQLREQYQIRGVYKEEPVIVRMASSALGAYQEELITTLANEKNTLAKHVAALETLENENGAVDILGNHSGVSIKEIVLFAVLGSFLGGACITGIWMLVYFLGRKLYTVTDMERKFGVKLLGIVYDTQEYKGPDRWIARKRGGIYSSLSKEEQQEIVLSNVKNELKKNGIEGGRIFLSSSLGATMEEAADFLIQGLKAAGYEIEACRNILGHADALEQLQQCHATLVAENPEETRVELLTEELNVLREYAGNITGMVVLR